MSQIFISYRRKGGNALAYLLYFALKGRGYQPFLDFESIKNGEFDNKIYDTMNDCLDYLLICSLNALDPRPEYKEDWFFNEIRYALTLASKSKLNIIPIFVDDFEYPVNLPEDIKSITKYNAIKISYEFFDGFLGKIEERLTCSNFMKIENKEQVKLRTNNVLVWADFNDNLLKKLLKKVNVDNEYQFEIIEAPTDLLKANNLDSYHAILFLDVDMDRLGDSERKVKSVNQIIKDYVDGGGLFVCSHDIVFRKMHNDILIDMMGMWTNFFEAVPDVHYLKQEACSENGLFASLPDDFYMKDAEECWGDVAPDNTIYFASDKGRPLVVGNDYGDGAWFWLNTGDARQYPPEAILKTDNNFALLIKEALRYKNDN